MSLRREIVHDVKDQLDHVLEEWGYHLIDLQLNDIHYNLQIKDKFLSKGVYTHAINVKHSSSMQVDIPVVIKYNKPLKTLWLVARNEDKLNYKLNIKLNVRINNMENINVIPVELDAIGNIELVK